MASNNHNNQKVPVWNGDHATFEEYRERVRWFTRSAKHKAQVGPQLAQSLVDEAWKALEEISDEGMDLIGTVGGEKILLKFLEESLLDLPIPEASKYMKEYLFALRRRTGESMKAYAQRSRVLADKLEKAFTKIEEKHRTP